MRTEAKNRPSDNMPHPSCPASRQEKKRRDIYSMEQIRSKLMLTLDELLRMEDEGKSGLLFRQAEEIQKLSRAIRELDALMLFEKQGSGLVDRTASDRRSVEAQ